jgi:hypothetical protein
MTGTPWKRRAQSADQRRAKRKRATALFIEYDVGDDGMIEVIALINAIEEKVEPSWV